MAMADPHSRHSHGHSHSHFQGDTPILLEILGHKLFPYDPLVNTICAVTALTALTQLLIALSPQLLGAPLHFLVAFAEGGMLGTVFLHMLPETGFSQHTGVLVITGFLSFVAIDKIMRIVGSGSGHEHGHNHGHSHGQGSSEASEKSKVDESPASQVSPWLNILADSLHNLTDGVSLALSFNNGPSVGLSAFLVMCCHEIPHQFGDYAVLINNGTSKSVARKAQLITALGTLVGGIIGSLIGSLGAFEDSITAVTAGVFLYVACVGVLPELLETQAGSVKENAWQGLVQLLGVVMGAAALLYLD